MKYIIWLPGYTIIAILYFLPKEVGKKRNVSKGSRWWIYKDTIAPILSLIIYSAVLYFIIKNSGKF